MRRGSRQRRSRRSSEKMKRPVNLPRRMKLQAGRRALGMLNPTPSIGGMRRFAGLAATLGTSTKTNDKLEALQEYFAEAEDADKVWVIALFSGRRPKRAVNTTLLWEWCRELTGLPGWLFEESYHTVGDLAETISLLLPDATDIPAEGRSLTFYLQELSALSKKEEADKKAFVLSCWAMMN